LEHLHHVLHELPLTCPAAGEGRIYGLGVGWAAGYTQDCSYLG
jgi:hypothetical protein